MTRNGKDNTTTASGHWKITNQIKRDGFPCVGMGNIWESPILFLVGFEVL